jgi:hypothetical protein
MGLLWWCVCSIRRIKWDIRSVLDVNKTLTLTLTQLRTPCEQTRLNIYTVHGLLSPLGWRVRSHNSVT